MEGEESSRFLLSSQSIISNFYELISLPKNLSKEIKDKIMKCVDELAEVIKGQNQVICGLKDQISNELNKCVEKQSQQFNEIIEKLDQIGPNTGRMSYANVLSAPPTGLKKNFSRKMDKNVVIVKPKNGGTCKQTEAAIKSVAKKKLKYGSIEEIKNTSRGGLAIKCRSEEDIDDVIQMAAECQDLEAFRPKKKNPLITVYGVDEDITKEIIIDQICSNNKDIKDYLSSNKQKPENHLKVRTVFNKNKNQKTGQSDPRPQRQTFILEISPAIHKILINLRSILIDLRAYRWADYVSITRCYKCQRFGHIAKYCREQETTCGLCAEHHETRQCLKQESDHKCINCVRFNRLKNVTKKADEKHTVFSDKCQRLITIRSQIKANIIYE
jgi:hypothetical protein